MNGPVIKYHGQSPCGGASGQRYRVQSFRVKLLVKKGEYVAIKARSTGTLSCSGGNGFLLYAPPLPVADWLTGIALGVGGLAGAYTGARTQARLPDLLIRRVMGILVFAIGIRYLVLGAG